MGALQGPQSEAAWRGARFITTPIGCSCCWRKAAQREVQGVATIVNRIERGRGRFGFMEHFCTWL